MPATGLTNDARSNPRSMSRIALQSRRHDGRVGHAFRDDVRPCQAVSSRPCRRHASQHSNNRALSASGHAVCACKKSFTRWRGTPRTRASFAFDPRFRRYRFVCRASSFQIGVSAPGRSVRPGRGPKSGRLPWRAAARTEAAAASNSTKPSAAGSSILGCNLTRCIRGYDVLRCLRVRSVKPCDSSPQDAPPAEQGPLAPHRFIAFFHRRNAIRYEACVAAERGARPVKLACPKPAVVAPNQGIDSGIQPL